MALVTSHNEFLRKTKVIPIYNLKGFRIPIQMDDITTTLTEELYKATTVDGECLITDISQINSGAINVITAMESKEKVQKSINNFLDHQIGDLDETNKITISHFDKSPVRSGRDYQLPTTITTYKNIFKKHTKTQTLMNNTI